jgi:putative endonuclease
MGREKAPTREAGREAERLAARFLREKGYRILATNYLTRVGEIDIVAERQGQLVFVEVRSLRSRARHLPEETVTLPKQARLSRTALAYIQENGLEDRPARFDVLGVETSTGRPAFRHIEDAFEFVEF